MTLPNLLAFTPEEARQLSTSRLLRLMDHHVVREVLCALDGTLMPVSAGHRLLGLIEHVQTLAMVEIDRRIPIPGDPRPAWAIGPDPRP